MGARTKLEHRAWRAAFCALGAWLVLGMALPAAAQSNPIQIENARAGTSDWRLANPADHHEIEGYANLTSVNRGGSISFYVSTQDSAYTIEVFRMGWYGGLGARRETAALTLPGVALPMPSPDPATGMVECNWSSQYTLTVNNPSDPADWVSGVYVAKLTALSSGKSSWIIFVVRDDARASDLLYQLPFTTFEAYNNWGGKSVYDFNSTGGISAVKVSFNRPYAAERWNGAGDFFDFAYSLLQFLEQQGYDVAYSGSVDTHTSGLLLMSHKAFLAAAHDEYWSWEMRQNVTGARDAGLNLRFFGSNDVYWQIRFEPSPITGDANRTVVCYKSNWPQDPMAANPSTYYLITNRWRDARASLPGLPEHALVGEIYNEKQPVSADVVIGSTSIAPVDASSGQGNASSRRDHRALCRDSGRSRIGSADRPVLDREQLQPNGASRHAPALELPRDRRGHRHSGIRTAAQFRGRDRQRGRLSRGRGRQRGRAAGAGAAIGKLGKQTDSEARFASCGCRWSARLSIHRRSTNWARKI